MKRAMITARHGNITLKVPAETVAATFISAALAHVGTGQPAANQGDVPPLGEYWPGEGGHNAGLIRGENGQPDYYLIVPAWLACCSSAASRSTLHSLRPTDNRTSAHRHQLPAGAARPGENMARPNNPARHQAKLTPERVRKIRQNPFGKTAKQLAAEHDVHFRTIEKVRAYQTWGCV